MELRKLIQHGNSSLTLSLPAKWLKSKNLKKGDQIEIIEKDESLILNPINYSTKDEIEIDISNLDRTSATIYIQSIFRLGFKIIKIKFSNEKIFHIRKNIEVDTINTIYEISKRLVGAEITNQGENNLTITQITTDNYEDLEKILRRLFLLILDTSKIFLKYANENDLNLLKSMDEKHRTINNLSNYYLRLLNKFSIGNEKQRLLNYHIIASFEKIIDIYKYNSRFILKNEIKISQPGKEFIEKIDEVLNIYYSNYYLFNQKKVFEMAKIRNTIKNSLNENLTKFSKEELIILSAKKEIPDKLIDLINFPINF